MNVAIPVWQRPLAEALASPLVMLLTILAAIVLPLTLFFNMSFATPLLHEIGLSDLTGPDADLHGAHAATNGMLLSALTPHHF